MNTFRIALFPGDGIGPEVMREAVRVLAAVEELDGSFRLDTTGFPWGTDHYLQHGHVVPDNFLEILCSFDAVFLGALGDPARVPDHIMLNPLMGMRQGFDQYVSLRPCRLFAGIPSPLASPGKIDFVVVRENSEGEYAICGGRFKQNFPEEVAIQTAIHTRKGIERILRFGFNLAMQRRRKLTMITKSNALKFGMTLWDEVLEQFRAEFPEVEADRQHADFAAMDFVRRPQRFDVVVASNLFGDILSDLGAAIIGGIGLAPSANINPDRQFPSLFEPVHGSAPDIVGKGIANPVAQILSGAAMLEWLGATRGAQIIRQAVDQALEAGAKTPDLGGSLTTTEMADRILHELQAAGA